MFDLRELKLMFLDPTDLIIHNINKFLYRKKVFDLRELKLMFLDPADLIINNLNKYLYRNKVIKFIFS